MIEPRSVLLYEVYPQLDAFAVDGVARIVGAFANIAEEANRVAENAFAEYGTLPGEGDMGDFADSALEEGIAYYTLLSSLKQGVLNLMAVGLYHLYEQHRERVKQVMVARGQKFPEIETFSTWPTIDELRLLANTAKHADGPSAKQLRQLRPEYFVDPMMRGLTAGRTIAVSPRRLANPLGGTDLFVESANLEAYRDALRSFWEEMTPYL